MLRAYKHQTRTHTRTHTHAHTHTNLAWGGQHAQDGLQIVACGAEGLASIGGHQGRGGGEHCRADEGREVARVLGVEGVGHDATYARWGLELERDESQ